MKRKAVPLAILVAAAGLVLVSSGVGASAVSRIDHHPTTTTNTLGSLPPPTKAQDARAVKIGCGALGAWSAILSAVPRQSTPQDFQAINTGRRSPWYKVTGMEGASGVAKYKRIAADARGFIQSYSLARTDGDPTVIQESTAALIIDCAALGRSTGKAPKARPAAASRRSATTIPSGGPTTVPGAPMDGTAQTAYGPEAGQMVTASAGNVNPDPFNGIDITFVVENRGTQFFRSSPNQQLIVTDYAGRTYTPLATTVFPDYGGTTTMGPGVSQTSSVTVPMPAGDAPRTVTYDPFGSPTGTLTWTVDG